MLTALAFAFIVFALAVALRSSSGSFDVSRERLRADARRPASVAAIYVVLAAFIALTLVTGSGNWKAALFAFAVGSLLLTAVFWAARR